MSEKRAVVSHEVENPVYTIQGKRFVVTPVYPKENGENVGEILLKLMCGDEGEKT